MNKKDIKTLMSKLGKLSHKKSPRNSEHFRNMALKRWVDKGPSAIVENEVLKCIEWLNLCRKTKTFNLNSYSAKHVVERWYGDYISNDSFKEAVIRLGLLYKNAKKDSTSQNIVIGISKIDIAKHDPNIIEAKRRRNMYK
jgi:hypothetical protein